MLFHLFTKPEPNEELIITGVRTEYFAWQKIYYKCKEIFEKIEDSKYIILISCEALRDPDGLEEHKRKFIAPINKKQFSNFCKKHPENDFLIKKKKVFFSKVCKKIYQL